MLHLVSVTGGHKQGYNLIHANGIIKRHQAERGTDMCFLLLAFAACVSPENAFRFLWMEPKNKINI